RPRRGAHGGEQSSPGGPGGGAGGAGAGERREGARRSRPHQAAGREGHRPEAGARRGRGGGTRGGCGPGGCPGAAPRGRRTAVPRDRGAILAPAAGQCDGELHQGRAAHPGADPARRQERSRPAFASGDEREHHHHDQVTRAVATAALPALGTDADRYRYRYIIAMTVSLASVLELLDTSIVNVAIPHMMGNLGATLDEIAWVSTGYIVANVIIL